MAWVLASAFVVAWVAGCNCGFDPVAERFPDADGAEDDAGRRVGDAGQEDAGSFADAGHDGGGASDAGAPDSGAPDAGQGDAGQLDAGSFADSGEDGGVDSGAPDSGGEADGGLGDGGSDAGCDGPPQGIIAWWDGDAVSGTTAFDIVGGYDGTMMGPVQIDPGEVGTAFDFTALDGGVVVVPDSPALNPTSALTVEAWVYPTSFFRAWQRVVSKQLDNQVVGSSFVLGIGSRGGIYFGCFKSGAQAFIDGATPLTLNAWNHVAGVWDGTSMRVYLDGVMQPETAFVAAPIDVSAAPVRLGRGDTMTYPFSGKADEVTLYGRALSDSEVEAIYAAGSAGKCKP